MKKKFVLVLIVALILVPSCLFAEATKKNIATEEELYDAIMAVRTACADVNEIWNITANIDITYQKPAIADYGYNLDLVINGNGHTISGKSTWTNENFTYVLYLKNGDDDSHTSNITINNLTIVAGDRVRDALKVERYCPTGELNCTLENVSIKADRDYSYTKGGNSKLSTLLQNNNANVIIKGECSFETDSRCWAAMDIDNEHSDAYLTFDDEAKIVFIDNRDPRKTSDPFLKVDKKSETNALVVTYPEAFPLHKTTYGHNLHIWDYSVEEGTITAKCADTSCAFHNSGVSISLEPLAKTTTIKTTVVPVFADNTKLEWTSYNPKVATVDENGNVTAVGAGTSTITAVTTDGSNLSINCEVTVKSL